MDILKLGLQLIALVGLLYGTSTGDILPALGGFTFIVLNLNADLEKVKRRIMKVEYELKYEGRLRKIEETLKMGKRAQLSSRELIIATIAILLLVWLWKSGFFNYLL